MESQQVHRRVPEEIIIEILSRLSVKSILRFKCVSKSWRSLISTKHFVKTHLENSRKNKTLAHHSIISFSLKPPDTLKGLSLHSLIINPETHAFCLDFPTNYSSIGLFVLGSCNGLICILVDNYKFLLWNPSTREIKELPDFFTEVKQTQRCIITRYGFGFDESSGDGDYKVYATFSIISDNRDIYDIGRMYSLKADSWGGEDLLTCSRESLDPFTLFVSGKLVSGKLHWINNSPSSLKWEIVSLDLKSETVGTVEHPTCLPEKYFQPKLVVLDGCLCVSCEYGTTVFDTCKLDIWICKEYGVGDSWSKLLTIASLHESWKTSLTLKTPFFINTHLTTLIMLPNGEVLFSYGFVFVLWNPKDNLFRQWYVADFDHVYDQAAVYSESLVSLSA